MTKTVVQPVILVGGLGSRLWPLSRPSCPKPFLRLTGDLSLFEQTLRRLDSICNERFTFHAPMIVGHISHRDLILDELKQAHVNDATLLLEPVSKNTAPALTIAAHAAQERGDDPVLVVFPADHAIQDERAFGVAVQEALVQAELGHVVVFGVKPPSTQSHSFPLCKRGVGGIYQASRSETGYGYLEIGEPMGTCYSVHAFREKPDHETARNYLNSNMHYWNAGIVVLKASTWLTLIARCDVACFTASAAAWDARREELPVCGDTPSPRIVQIPIARYDAITARSIDHAVMEPWSTRATSEKAHHALLMRVLDVGWCDLGTWESLYQFLNPDTPSPSFQGEPFLCGTRSLSYRGKIFVAGHTGLVGSAIVRALLARGVDASRLVLKTHRELDLTDQGTVRKFFSEYKPECVYLAAAHVGGIHANNTYPAQFIYTNLMIEANVIDAAFQNGVKRLLFLGSSCIYPKYAEQPMVEEALLSGSLEPTNAPYALAKIAGLTLCESYTRQYGESHGVDYRAVMPCNVYGPGDRYHDDCSHVIPALMWRFHHAAKTTQSRVTIWGSGAPLREFLYVDDLAAACLWVMGLDRAAYEGATSPDARFLNVCSGDEISIAELAQKIAKIVGYRGDIGFDSTKPDGVMRKVLDSSRLRRLGWTPSVDLEDGLRRTYAALSITQVFQ